MIENKESIPKTYAKVFYAYRDVVAGGVFLSKKRKRAWDI